MTTDSTEALMSKLQDGVKEAIVGAFKARGRSVTDGGYMTGNHYQSIRLGDEYVYGFRSAREDIFAGIDFKGKSVLDLGCNFGEMSRHASRKGARSVQGYEYDPYFVKLGNYINVYNGIDNVKITQGDITKKYILEKNYDIILAFSVFKMLGNLVEELVNATNEILVVETHSLSHENLGKFIDNLAPKFNQTFVYQASELSIQDKSEEIRAVIIFAKKNVRWGFVRRRLEELPAKSRSMRSIDLAGSSFGPVLDFDNFVPEIRELLDSDRDIHRLAEKALALRLPWEMDSEDASSFSPASGYYWLSYLRGFAESVAQGAVDTQNHYVRYLRLQYSKGKFDPGLKHLMDDDEKIVERVKLRFDDLAKLATSEDTADMTPVVLFNPLSATPHIKEHLKRHVRFTTGEDTLVSAIDGYHRIFGSRISGKPEIAAMCLWDKDCEPYTELLAQFPELYEDSLAKILELTSETSDPQE